MTDKWTYTESMGDGMALVAGSGVAFMSYLAVVPGLLPCILLAGLLLVPLLVVGVLLLPVAGLVLLVRRVTARR
jgi:hypothetical protein